MPRFLLLLSAVTAPLSILHVLVPGAAGGIESVVRLLATAQRRRGHDVRVLAAVDEGNDCRALLDALGAAGVEVVAVQGGGRGYAREYRAVRDACLALHPAVVHTHGYRADVLAGLAARHAGLATVTTVHGFTGGDWKNRLYELLQRRAFRRFDAVVAVSEPLARSLRSAGVREGRVHVVPNAFAAEGAPVGRVAARRALGIGARECRVAWIGRISPEKGLDLALRAFAQLGDGPARLSVLGDGAERARCERLAERLGVADRVTWHGVVPDAGRLVGAFDALVLSSRTEGTPMVLLEAMGAGVPIVAAAVGGVPDLLSDAEAWLVPPGEPAALAAALREVLRSPAAAAARAAIARRRLERRHAIEPWVARYDAVYAAVRRPRAGVLAA